MKNNPKNKLTKKEKQILEKFNSGDPHTIWDASHDLLKLTSFQIVKEVKNIVKKLPKSNMPGLVDYRDRVRFNVKLFEHYSKSNKCNCKFYEKYAFFFAPENETKHGFLKYIGNGKIDIKNHISEEIYECIFCKSRWITNINDSWHRPYYEWEKLLS